MIKVKKKKPKRVFKRIKTPSAFFHENPAVDQQTRACYFIKLQINDKLFNNKSYITIKI